VMKQVTLTAKHLSLSWFQLIVSSVIHDPWVQRTAITLINYMQQKRSIPQDQLLTLYDNWHEDNCNPLSKGWVTSLTWSMSHPWCELYPYRELLLDYLWYREAKTYLILLQNSAELRPNGGFYGSFVYIKLASGTIQDMSIHDSYEVPFINSWVALALPERTKYYLWHSTATFIAGNKFGFTERDGFTISAIYNKTYNTDIDGVFFVSTKTLTTLIPSLQAQLWKRQFINASIDLIRGGNTWFKKQLYMDELHKYISQNKLYLLGQALTNYQKLLEPSMIQIYLPDTNPDLRLTLKHLNRITDLEPQHLYLWDLNQAYNKIDTFVSKKASIQTHDNQEIIQSKNNMIDVSQLSPWAYKLKIDYKLSIPQQYIRTITQLQKQYNISLTSRERHILGIDPLFEYRSVLFAGTGIILDKVSGDADQTAIFSAPPAQWASYHIRSTGDVRTMIINFIVN
jgi:Protein of unknown function (DUF4012)